MATAYEQLNFLNQANQQALAPVNNFLAQRNALAHQQAEAARARAQQIEMMNMQQQNALALENIRNQHAIDAQRANFMFQQEAADKNVVRNRSEANRQKLIDAGWQLSPDLSAKEINDMADRVFSDPSTAELAPVEQATAIAGRLNTTLQQMTKELSSDTPESRKASLLAFAADPNNNSLLTVEGKIPQAMLQAAVNKGDVQGVVDLINKAARNAGWFSSDKQISSQLMAGLYSARAAANQQLLNSPMFQARQLEAKTLMQELGKLTPGIKTAEGWAQFGKALSPPGVQPPSMEEIMKQREAQAKIDTEAAERQGRVDTRLGVVPSLAPAAGAPNTPWDRGVLPWLGQNIKPAALSMVSPALAAGQYLPQMQQFAKSPMIQDAASGVWQGLMGMPEMVQTQTPHQQLAQELFAKGIYDPRLGVPQQQLRSGF